jgi:hypothetical protein
MVEMMTRLQVLYLQPNLCIIRVQGAVSHVAYVVCAWRT